MKSDVRTANESTNAIEAVQCSSFSDHKRIQSDAANQARSTHNLHTWLNHSINFTQNLVMFQLSRSIFFPESLLSLKHFVKIYWSMLPSAFLTKEFHFWNSPRTLWRVRDVNFIFRLYVSNIYVLTTFLFSFASIRVLLRRKQQHFFTMFTHTQFSKKTRKWKKQKKIKEF